MSTIYWQNPISDKFTNATDWSTGTAPGTFDIAKMTVAGTYTIISNKLPLTQVFGITTGSNTTLSIQSELIATEGTPTGANSGIIDIENGASLACGGAVDNVGHVALNASGTQTDFSANILEGGGDVSLSDDPNNMVSVGTNVDNTISGAGTIDSINNQALGVVIASGTNPLKLIGTVTNAGLLKASGFGSVLEIDADVTNTGTGVIEAGPGATVDLGLTQPIVIVGGTLKADSTSLFSFETGSITLDGSTDVVPTNKMLTISGQVSMHSGCGITLEGTINNTGEILMNNAADSLFVSAAGTLKSVILEGKGMISMSVSPLDSITGVGGSVPVVTLININNDIFGGGNIGGNDMALNNEAAGIIDASGSTPIVIDTGLNVVTNAGSLNADAGDELFIDSPLSNTGKMNSFGSTIIAAGKVTGTGTAIINLDGNIEFGAASSNGTRFATGSTGELILDDSKQYTGTIAGFGANITQSIDLTDVNFSTITSKSFAGGILTIKDSAGDIAHIKFSGTYTLASFHLASDGHGGVLITDPPVERKPQTSSTPQTSILGLLGNYIASSFASNDYGHGGIPTPLTEPLSPHPISLPHA